LEVKERRKEKERQKPTPKPTSDASVGKETPKTDTLVDVTETEAEEDSQTQELESIQTEIVPESAPSQVLELPAPQWGNVNQAEWMYHIPPAEKDIEMWAEEWSDYLMIWTEFKSIHVLSVSTFVKEKPFSDILGKVDAFRFIGESLVKKDVGEWLDEKKRQLRVYWRPLEEWGDIIYRWAIKTGKLRLDVQSIVVQESGQDFSKLPERDLHRIMQIMVDKGLAKWVDSKKGAILAVV